jgi:hypothetical protein
MNSRKELINMIAADASEVWRADKSSSGDVSQELPDMRYDLRLVRYEDGRLEWRE